MGDFDLSFNRQYSALIGGRGTGKSTVLEYLRWALGDEPRGDDLSEAEKKRQDLVQDTLVELGGKVEVELNINGVPHMVRRDGSGDQFKLKVGTDDFEDVPKKEIRELLPVQAYSQKQLSNVAVRIEELRRFVRAPVQDDLRDLDAGLESLKSDLRSAYIKVQKKRELQEDQSSVEREISSVQQQIEQAKDAMTDLSDGDRQILDQKEVYDREKETIQRWTDELKGVRSHLAELDEMTTSGPSSGTSGLANPEGGETNDQPLDGDFPDEDLMTAMRDQIDATLDAINSRAVESIAEIDHLLENESSFAEARQDFNERQEEFEEKYSSVRQRAEKHSREMKRLDKLTSREEDLRDQKQEIEEELSEIGEPAKIFERLREEWLKVHSQRSEILKDQCEALTDQSQELLRADLEVGGQTDKFVDLLKRKVKGSNLYTSKMESIFSLIPESDDPIEQYSEVMEDLETLALHDVDEKAELPSTPVLEECGLENDHLEKIARYLTPEDWLDLAVTPLGDEPQFEYKVQDDLYIDFASASAGQQATALLRALLNQEGPPLIIDQPEDDLDNQVIQDVVEEIWTAKHERQLIFASHNANLVVNGDADLVVCFESDMGGGAASGSIERAGAIDAEAIRTQITEIMEGGQDAFELRKEKYGF